jgi:uncharacterized protein YjbJ (UPF0337 family)
VNTLSIQGDWNTVVGKLKQRLANLTDNDLLYREGKENELWGGLLKEFGRTKGACQKTSAKL